MLSSPNPARSRRRLRTTVHYLHLWLGLLTGAVVFVVAITGCCWVFHEEIRHLSDGFRAVEPRQAPFIPPTQARTIAEPELPERHVHGVVYGREDEALEVIFWEQDPEFYRSVFLDPYSGEVLGVTDHLSGFFAFVLEGHVHLWLPETIGSQVVAWSTLLFVVVLTSGLFLWWPRGRTRRTQKFWFVWRRRTSWQRKVFDLHSIPGMYVFAVALLAALTGLVMAFDWFESGVYSALGGEKALEFAIPENTSSHRGTLEANGFSARATRIGDQRVAPIDRLPGQLRQRYPRARSFEIHYPTSERDSIYVEIAYEEGVHYSSDYRFYDRYTLEELNAPSLYGAYEDAALPDMAIRMNYDTHVGAILGLPTKILMFCASLMVASLPVSGFVFWWGTRRKSTRTAPHRPATAGRHVLSARKDDLRRSEREVG
jgi:uncharacterized iron-regulated membrane protein